MGEDTRYIFSNGDLFKKDNSIVFKKDGKNNYIPAEKVKELYCFNDCTITTKLLDMFGKTGTIIHFFNYYGNYSGTFFPKEQNMSGSLTVKQVNCYNLKKEEISKAIILGISKNIRFVLYHYYRHGKKELKETIDYMKNDVPRLLKKANTINSIMAVEGNMWQKFYESFNIFLPEEFVLNKRVRRPPDNPINALISFGNTFLYTKTITEIYQTHLNQTISFLHSPSEKRFSLCLDLSEVFKPIVVFSTIFDCVNNNKLKVEKHFEKKFNYCLLNEEGKKIFVKELDDRLNTSFEHPKLKRRITYKTAIKLDSYKLIKTILESIEFVPFDMEQKK